MEWGQTCRVTLAKTRTSEPIQCFGFREDTHVLDWAQMCAVQKRAHLSPIHVLGLGYTHSKIHTHVLLHHTHPCTPHSQP